ncbi:polyprotein [Bovine picornavirus]|uniref:Genome polyprotein n=1 Tax=Bopivirus A TaxID=2169775 RepID=A0A0B4WUQ1_9PICO|nr:polyprotein [Bovine picornavirus]AJD39294.1 polyprotein [Bopivirus A]
MGSGQSHHSHGNTNQSGNNGTVINNYYQQHYQNSIDLSGALSSSEVSGGDSFGSNGGGSGGASNVTNPDKEKGGGNDSMSHFTNLLSTVGVAATNALLADKQTEETTQLADRVVTLSSGNTAQNTQASVGLIRGYGRPDEGKPTSCVDDATEGVISVERGFTDRLTEWSTARKAYDFVAYPLPGRFRRGVFEKMIRQHYLTKNGYRVQVQCNASIFHAGCLYVGLVPEFVRAQFQHRLQDSPDWEDRAGFPFDPQQLTVFPHQLLNLRTNTTVDIEVPYVNVCPASSGKIHSPWTLLIVVLSPLQYAAGSSPVIDITATVVPTQFKAMGLRQYTAEGIVATDSSDRQQLCPEPTAETPGYVPGWKAPADYLGGEVDDFMQIARIPTYCSLNETETATTQDLPYFTVSNTLVEGPVLSADVTLSADLFAHTSLWGLGCMFSQYRGSIQLSFTFTGAAAARGKFLIAYVPPGEEPTTLEEAMLGTTLVWDIGLNSTVDFTIPFISATDYRYTHSLSQPTAVDVDGWVQVYQLTPITYPAGAPTTANVLVSASAGSDMCFRYPVDFLAILPQDTDDKQVTRNSESGNEVSTEAGQMIAASPAAQPNVGSHTNVRFLLDRFFYFDSVSGNLLACGHQRTEGSINLNLDPARRIRQLEDPTTTLEQLLCPITYYNSDLAIWVAKIENQIMADDIPKRISLQPAEAEGQPPLCQGPANRYNGCDSEIQNFAVVYTPPGTAPQGRPIGGDKRMVCQDSRAIITCDSDPPIQTTKTRVVEVRGYGNFHINGALGGGLNTVVWSKSDGSLNGVKFSVPYTSVLTAQPRVYNGYSSFQKQQNQFGAPPTPGYGNLSVYANSLASSFVVYLKLRGARLWCPRPFWTPIREVATSRMRFSAEDLLLLRGGDIESNPGPVFSKILDGASKAVNIGTALAKAYKQISKLSSFKFWKKIIKLICSLVGLASSAKNGDWVSFTAQAISLGLDGAPSVKSLFLKIARKFGLVKDAPNEPKPTGGRVKIPNLTEFSFSSMLPSFSKFKMPEFSNPFRKSKRPVEVSWPLSNPRSWSYRDGLSRDDDWGFNNPFYEGPDSDDSSDEFEPEDLGTVNGWFNVIKNTHWLFTQIANALDWLKKKICPKKDEKSELLEIYERNFSNLARPLSCNRDFFKKQYIRCLSAGLHRVADHWYDCYKKCNLSARPEPVCLVLRGKPGQGKSVSASLIAKAVSAICTGEVSVWSLPVDSDHFDGYANQHTVIIDDLGQNPDGADYRNFCQMVSSTPFLPPMASLSDKGIAFTSPFIIVTTNKPDGFVPVTISTPDALSRRFTFQYTVAAVDGFKVRGGYLDYQKAVEPTLDFPDIPIFTKDCPLLNGMGLSFTPNSPGQATKRLPSTSLYGVVREVVEELKRRENLERGVSELVPEDDSDSESEFDTDDEADELATRLYNLVTKRQRRLFPRVWERFKANLRDANKWRRFGNDAIIGFGAIAMLLTAFYAAYSLYRAKGFWDDLDQQFETAPESPYNGGNPRRREKTMRLRAEDGGVLEVLMDNAVPVQLTRELPDGRERVSSFTGYLLRGRCLMVPNHSFSKDWVRMHVCGFMFHRDEITSVAFTIGGMESDAMMVHLPKRFPAAKDRTNLLSDFTPPRGAELLVMVNNEVRKRNLISGTMIGKRESVPITNNRLFPSVISYSCHTENGFCCAPVVAKERGRYVIVAFHCAGNGSTGFASVIPKRFLLEACDALEKQTTPTHDTVERVDLEQPDTSSAMEAEHITSMRTADKASYIPRRSNLRPSPVYDGHPSHEPAVLSSYDDRLEDPANFEKNLLAKNDAMPQPCDESLRPWLERAAKDYAAKLFSVVGKDNELLDLRTAIEGLDHLEALDMHTSPGLPYTDYGARRVDLFGEDGEPHPEVLGRIKRFLDGDYSEHVFQSFLKDELRPIAKCNAGATRVVEVAAVDHVIVGRMLLGKFTNKLLINHGDQDRSAIGVNPDLDWTRYYYDFHKFRYVYDFDYKAFDSSHSKLVFQVVRDHVFNPENGFDARAQAYIDSLCFSTHRFGDVEYTTDGALPSGCSGTTVVNNMINNIIVRAALRMVYTDWDDSDIGVVAYGDDLLLGCNTKLDLTKLADAFKQLGYTVTPADKNGVFNPDSTIDSVTFLKRRFVRDSLYPYLIHPVMDAELLANLLKWQRAGEFQQKVISIAQLLMHSGEADYESVMEPVRYYAYVPTYDSLYDDWLNEFGFV